MQQLLFEYQCDYRLFLLLHQLVYLSVYFQSPGCKVSPTSRTCPPFLYQPTQYIIINYMLQFQKLLPCSKVCGISWKGLLYARLLWNVLDVYEPLYKELGNFQSGVVKSYLSEVLEQVVGITTGYQIELIAVFKCHSQWQQ